MTNSDASFDWTLLTPEPSGAGRLFGQRLERLISDGVLAPGVRIPTERELAVATRLSRTTVREALRDLEQRGLVDRRRGRGTVVTVPSRPELRASMLSAADGRQLLLREVMDLRAAIEPPIAERAAARRNDLDIADLREILSAATRGLEAASVDIEEMARLDVAFHSAISRATQNSMLAQLVDVTHQWMAPARQRALQSPRRLRESVAAHTAILVAIESQDIAAAGRAMTQHIMEVLAAIGLEN